MLNPKLLNRSPLLKRIFWQAYFSHQENEWRRKQGLAPRRRGTLLTPKKYDDLDHNHCEFLRQLIERKPKALLPVAEFHLQPLIRRWNNEITYNTGKYPLRLRQAEIGLKSYHRFFREALFDVTITDRLKNKKGEPLTCRWGYLARVVDNKAWDELRDEAKRKGVAPEIISPSRRLDSYKEDGEGGKVLYHDLIPDPSSMIDEEKFEVTQMEDERDVEEERMQKRLKFLKTVTPEEGLLFNVMIDQRISLREAARRLEMGEAIRKRVQRKWRGFKQKRKEQDKAI
jgi:hypothetical protein